MQLVQAVGERFGTGEHGKSVQTLNLFSVP